MSTELHDLTDSFLAKKLVVYHVKSLAGHARSVICIGGLGPATTGKRVSISWRAIEGGYARRITVDLLSTLHKRTTSFDRIISAFFYPDTHALYSDWGNSQSRNNMNIIHQKCVSYYNVSIQANAIEQRSGDGALGRAFNGLVV